MNIQELIAPFLWIKYPKKLHNKIANPRNSGHFSSELAKEREMHLANGQAGSINDGNVMSFYCLVDPDDGIIMDCKFQVFGHSVLIGIAEICCEAVIGKNYDQAKRINPEVIEKQLGEKNGEFPKETLPFLSLACSAMERAMEMCQHLPLPENYTIASNLSYSKGAQGEFEGWETLSIPQKIGIIEQVIAEEIRPYIEIDEGGIEIKNLIGDEVIISYKGSCTSCFSSVGTTLAYIQQILKNKVHHKLSVVPDYESLNF